MMNYLLRGIPDGDWQRFQDHCKKNGKTVAKMLRHIIKETPEETVEEKKFSFPEIRDKLNQCLDIIFK